MSLPISILRLGCAKENNGGSVTNRGMGLEKLMCSGCAAQGLLLMFKVAK